MALYTFTLVHHCVCRCEPGFSLDLLDFSQALFWKSGAICRVARQDLPPPGKNCPAPAAARQLSPGHIFRAWAKSMFKQI
jgi:hypothetical protein